MQRSGRPQAHVLRGQQRQSPPKHLSPAQANFKADGPRSRARQLPQAGSPNTMARLDSEWEGRNGPWEPDFGAAPAHRRHAPLERAQGRRDLNAAFPLSVHKDVEYSEEEQQMLEILEQRANVDLDDVGAIRTKFGEWLQNFHDQERRFTSPMVLCQVQYNEILEYTEGWPEPNMLRTAACSVLFDKLVPCYAMKRDSLLERLKDDLLHAVYSRYDPQVASSAAYCDHTPYFVVAEDAEKRQLEVDRRYEEVLHKEQIQKSNKTIVKSVEARKLDALRWYVMSVFYQTWADVIARKHWLIEGLRRRIEAWRVQVNIRAVFQDWKLQAVVRHISNLQRNILYLEELVESLGKDNPEVLAKAKAKAAAIVQDVDEVSLDEVLHNQDEQTYVASNEFATRRPLTWHEKLRAMYRDAGKAKLFTKAHTLDTIAEIYAAKVKHDAEQDRTGSRRQPLPDFCFDLFLIQTGVGSNALKRLNELIASVRKFESVHPRIKTFSYLMNATNEHSDWDPQAANFLLCALVHVVPDWLILSRLFQESSRPTIGLMDSLQASKVAFESRFSLGLAPVTLEENLRALAAKNSLTESDLRNVKVKQTSSSENFVRMCSSEKSAIDNSSVILLDSWMEYLTSTWIDQFQTCRRKTLDAMFREQRLHPNEGGVLSFVQFQVCHRARTLLHFAPIPILGRGVERDAVMQVVHLRLLSLENAQTGGHADKPASHVCVCVCT
jgi:hypothetical protein